MDLENTRLSGNSPCSRCDIYKNYAESGLPGSCKHCLQHAMYQLHCMQKLEEYENNDPRLK